MKGFKEFLEMDKAPAPLTEAEEDKLEIKKAEANPDIGKANVDCRVSLGEAWTKELDVPARRNEAISPIRRIHITYSNCSNLQASTQSNRPPEAYRSLLQPMQWTNFCSSKRAP